MQEAHEIAVLICQMISSKNLIYRMFSRIFPDLASIQLWDGLKNHLYDSNLHRSYIIDINSHHKTIEIFRIGIERILTIDNYCQDSLEPLEDFLNDLRTTAEKHPGREHD